MILGVGDRVRRDAEIVGRMKTLDDDTVEKDRDIFHKKNSWEIYLILKEPLDEHHKLCKTIF